MIKLDVQEEKIVKELIKNPRQSDNQVSKKTKVPVMTVNRKRKQLEQKGFLRYYTELNLGEKGTGLFISRQLYIIKFKIGITSEKYLESLEYDAKFRKFKANYINESYLGEKDGHLSLVLIIDAKSESKLVDEFNGKLVPYFIEKLGEDCIKEVVTTKLTETIRKHHNYMPHFNMDKGTLKDDWIDDWIFVDKV